jgi:SAM-dependent methyltransferase
MPEEWSYQWERFEDDTPFLFDDWIAPLRLTDLAGRTVFEAGCGRGHHTRRLAQHAAQVVAVDIECAGIAQRHTAGLPNVEVRAGDVATIDLGRQFDVVVCVGVIHHTADPDRTFANLARHVKPGGRIVVWCYSREGNAAQRWLVEPAKTVALKRLPRGALVGLSHLLTGPLTALAHTLYRAPVRALPYYEYFGNWRRLSYHRNLVNVFDKLNAPQTHWIARDRAERWVAGPAWTNRHLSPYKGVSWRVSATRTAEPLACAASLA